MTRGRAVASVAGLLAVIAVVITWPQAEFFGTRAVPHQDVYFNMWRLRWFAHAIVHAPARLFDANIFYPEPRTLTFSDAMPVEGLVGAPLLWAGLRPVLVHNVLIFGAMVASGVSMFALVRYLTGSRGAGVIAAVPFAFAPYRFEHVMHMELQWAMWSPLAFLFFHRTLRNGGWRNGLLTGVFVALQMLSSIYYGVFLGFLLGAGGLLLFLSAPRTAQRAAAGPLLAGAAVCAVVCAVYAQPYLATRDKMGGRPVEQVVMFSARPSSYLIATPDNWLYGGVLQSRGRPERRLFPGALVTLLAMVGVLLPPPSKRTIVYLLLLALAFEMSLGFSGHVYGWLYHHVSVFEGLRAVARLGIFVLLFLSVLAGYGYAAMVTDVRPSGRAVVVIACVAIMTAEYRVMLPLSDEYPNAPPQLYRALAAQPRGVVAEFPVPALNALPGPDAEYTYSSTFTWFPLVNGYSGTYPSSYLDRLDRLQRFPDDRALRQLAADGVEYVVLHDWPHRREVMEAMEATHRFSLVGAYGDSRRTIGYLYRFH